MKTYEELVKEVTRKQEYLNNYIPAQDGHWYDKEKKVLELTDEEYELLCKRFPPYITMVKGFIQEIYNKGYRTGYRDGENNA